MTACCYSVRVRTQGEGICDHPPELSTADLIEKFLGNGDYWVDSVVGGQIVEIWTTPANAATLQQYGYPVIERGDKVAA